MNKWKPSKSLLQWHISNYKTDKKSSKKPHIKLPLSLSYLCMWSFRKVETKQHIRLASSVLPN